MRLIVEQAIFVAIDRRKLASKHVRNSSYQNTAIGINSEITKPEKSSNATSTADEKLGGEISLKPVDAARWVSDESESTCQICKVQVFSIVSFQLGCFSFISIVSRNTSC